MKNGQCPRCGSKEIYSGANIPLKSGPFAGNAIPISLLSMAALDNYVCVGCGLVESYIADASKLEEVVKSWDKVEPEAGSGE
jgi:predicted nucleic-acid-binding Zn-ribbon protein